MFYPACFPTVGLMTLGSGDFFNTLHRLSLREVVVPTAPSSLAFFWDVPVLLSHLCFFSSYAQSTFDSSLHVFFFLFGKGSRVQSCFMYSLGFLPLCFWLLGMLGLVFF